MLTIQFFFHLMLTCLIALALGAVGMLLGLYLAQRLHIKEARAHALHLENRGNCRSTFQLTAGSPEAGLSFRFLAGEVPLPAVYRAGEAASEPAAQAEGKHPKAEEKPSKSGQALEGAVKGGESAAGAAGKAGSFLGGLGALLPGKAGEALKEQADKAHFMEVDALRATRAPGTLTRQVRSLRPDSFERPGARPETRLGGKDAAPLSASTISAQTGEVAPGQALDLTLEIRPFKPRALRGSYPYLLLVEQIALDYPDLPAEELSRGGAVFFNPPGFWRAALPYAAYALITFSGLSLFGFALLKIWF